MNQNGPMGRKLSCVKFDGRNLRTVRFALRFALRWICRTGAGLGAPHEANRQQRASPVFVLQPLVCT